VREISRRGFLQGSAAVAGGLVVGCRSVSPPSPTTTDGAAVHRFDAWLRVTGDDRILLYADKVEMGQGTFTLYATSVAEELDVDLERVELEHAPVDDAYPTGVAPMQVTGGSTSTIERHLLMRESGARARAMLVTAAAERFAVEPSSLRTEDGVVIHEASGRRATYGELADAAARCEPPDEVALKTPDRFRYIGKEIPRVDAAAKARGTAVYGIDARVPGLHSAVVVRLPIPGARVTGYDEQAARAVSGVEQLFPISTGIAIVATNTWRARRAAEALDVRFELPQGVPGDSGRLRREHERILADEQGDEVVAEGDVEEAIAGSARQLDVVYHTPHQAHATMEPMNCTVVPGPGRIDVHIGTQAPSAVQDVVAAVFGCSRSEVVVHTAFLGGGFGRRSLPDVAREAAEIARRAGVPIKLVYSREDDTAHDFYRPATAHRLRGGVSADGRPLAWSHHIVAPSMLQYMLRGTVGALAPEWLRGAIVSLSNLGAGLVGRVAGPVLSLDGATEVPYAIPNRRVASTLYDPGIPVGIWRSVGHSNNGFVIESFVDELAHAAGADPVSFRRTLLAAHPRHVAVLDLALAKAGRHRQEGGRGRGIAVYESFGSPVAEVAEVIVDGHSIRVEQVTCAVHCGTAINPDIVRAQIEGGVVYGLSAALKSQMTFRDGVPVQTNFHDYPVLRMNETPEIAVHIVPSDDPPTGIGEPGTPPIAAAVANAIFDATGMRLRELPLRMPEDVA
jgi:isoquinoline 1-oxidoreductase beta subunit